MATSFTTGLRSYDEAFIQHGYSQLIAATNSPATGICVDGFQAGLVDETEVEIDVPPMDLHVLAQVMSERPLVFTDFNCRKRSAVQLRPRYCLSVPAGTPSWWDSRQKSGLVLHISFQQAALERWAGGNAVILRPYLQLYDPELDRATSALVRELHNANASTGLYLEGLALQIAATLMRIDDHSAKRTYGKGKLAGWQLRRITQYLADCLHENVSIADLAHLANLSHFHFARAFKRTTGKTPHGFVRAMRCDRAKQLLINSNLSVGAISVAVGYETPQAFARMFRAEVGASPSEFRRQMQA
ncbi:MAG: AraC family transcriptional regulator [Sphingopyxis sp.]|nr:AraC family transcriptional regulator [Sphingopyxis sp.]